jgi:hypothetical protein
MFQTTDTGNNDKILSFTKALEINPRNHSLQNSNIKLERFQTVDNPRDTKNLETHNQSVEKHVENFKHFTLKKGSQPVNSALNQTMYQTLTLSTASAQNSKFKTILKSKLCYEWKNIYRQLSALDK